MESGQNNVSITAPTITGYRFICWIGCSTNGWVSWSYIDTPLSSTAKIWTSTVDRSRALQAFALYVKA